MAGHSHWAGIKHKKAREDAKRGKIFSKCAKQITIAARHGGGDPDANLNLKYAIDKAKQANMPRDNIERAIKKGTGELEGGDLEQITYEGYGPKGVAVMVEILTDNRNRTFGEVKKIFEKKGGNIGANGCVAWMFEVKGLFMVEESAMPEDDLMELVLEAGAEDMTTEDGLYQITSEATAFDKVKTFLEEKGVPLKGAEITRIPTNTIPLTEKEGAKVLGLLEELDDHDDVQNVHANFDLQTEGA